MASVKPHLRCGGLIAYLLPLVAAAKLSSQCLVQQNANRRGTRLDTMQPRPLIDPVVMLSGRRTVGSSSPASVLSTGLDTDHTRRRPRQRICGRGRAALRPLARFRSGHGYASPAATPRQNRQPAS